MKCDECGGKVVHYDTGFVMRLDDREFPTTAAYRQCEKCETWTISHAELVTAEVESAVQILTEIDRPLPGPDLKWARKAGCLSPEEVAGYLGIDPEEYADTERSLEPVPFTLRFAMAWLVEEFGYRDQALRLTG